MTSIFIDGREGTTGLHIWERLAARTELELIPIPEERRKDPAARKACLNQADVAILCLPDAAAAESVAMIENPHTRVLDTSTAHRTHPDWVYGFPELNGEQRERIAASKRAVVPGCHASGFVALIAPLVQAGTLNEAQCLACHSVTGYSGGGKKMIAQYEAKEPGLLSPRQYGLAQSHKHLKEMTAVTGLKTPPAFCPIVSGFYSGMAVTVPVFGKDLRLSHPVEELRELYQAHYRGQGVVKVLTGEETEALDGFLAADALSGKDTMEIIVTGNRDRVLLISRFDNLGKGSSGAAVQCLNLMLGAHELTGLAVE